MPLACWIRPGGWGTATAGISNCGASYAEVSLAPGERLPCADEMRVTIRSMTIPNTIATPMEMRKRLFL